MDNTIIEIPNRKKRELLEECLKILETPKIAKWYNENFERKPQSETINTLEKSVVSKKLTIREALNIALIVGIQWDVKFEDTP